MQNLLVVTGIEAYEGRKRVGLSRRWEDDMNFEKFIEWAETNNLSWKLCYERYDVEFYCRITDGKRKIACRDIHWQIVLENIMDKWIKE